MKKWILFANCLFAILLFSLWPRKQKENLSTADGTKPKLNLNIEKASRFRLAETEDQDFQNQWLESNTKQSWTNDPRIRHYFDNIFKDPKYDWKHDINFWGVLLDQHDDPIGHAAVHFVWSDLSNEGTSSTKLQTDNDGRFALLGKIGKGLSVRVSKDGYRDCRSGSIGFEYANPTDRAYHQPDPERPVLFRLIKMGPPEPLVQRSRMAFRCSDVSGDLHLDLLGQRQVGADDPEVDLVVHAEHGPIREVDGRRWFDWKVILSVPNGGLVAGTECPPAAPEDGYLPRLEFQGKVEGRYSMDGVDDWFFFKSRDGRHFGRVHLKVSAAPDGGGAPKVYLAEYVLNPAGSRGLEFYPEMDVSVKYYAPR